VSTLLSRLTSAAGNETQRSVQILNRTALILLFLSLGYIALASLHSWDTQKSVYLENLTSVAELEARAVDAYFNRIELDSGRLGEELKPDAAAIDLDRAYTLLKRFKTLHPELFNVTLLDASGRLMVTANSAPNSVQASVASTSSFTASLAEFGKGAHFSIGQPITSMISGTVIVPLRYAIRRPSGELDYILSSNLPHEYLRAYWADAPITQHAALGLLRDDGFLLSRFPVPKSAAIDTVYQQPRTGALVRYLRDQNFPHKGSVEGESSLDGPGRLSVFRRLPSYPVTLFVALPIAEIQSAWWREMWKTYLLAALALSMGFGVYRYSLHQQRVWAKQNEAASVALRESEARWQFALEGSGEGVWDWDLSSNKVSVSRLYQTIFGQELPDQAKKMDDWTERIHPDDVVHAREKFQLLTSGATDTYIDEHRERCADGSWKWVQVRGKVVSRGDDGRPNRVIGTIYDASERIAREQQLRLLEASVAHTNDLVVITEAEPVDAPGPKIVFVNEAFSKRTGYQREEVIGKTPRFLQGPLTDRLALDRVRAALTNGQPVREEIINYTKAGEAFWIEMEIAPIANASGWFTHWVAVERDITQRKRTEEALVASEKRFRVAVDALQEGFVLQNRKAEILVCNKSAERILGISADQMMGRTSLDPRWRTLREDGTTFSGEAHPAVVTLRDGTPQTNVMMGIEQTDGARTWISINTAPIFDGDESRPSGVVATFTDITEQVAANAERRGLEAQLREAQKMEALGTLAGGIAHDFNNILAAILGNVSLAKEDAGDNSDVRISLNEITKAAGRAKTLVEQILSFSRRQPHEYVAQPIFPLIEEAVGLLRATIPANTKLSASTTAPGVYASCNASQISQVLINLCTNSWHALPKGQGEIDITLDEIQCNRSKQSADVNLPPGRYARIRIADNGSGMNTDTLARIFEPFFTTKPVGEGTGLGLAVVHGIIKAHNGHIRVDSTLGQGTHFDLYLPIVAACAAGLPNAEHAEAPAKGSGQHVVYIDDDEAMVMLTVRILEKRGYRASGFMSAAEALDLVRANPDDVDLIVTDYNMPGQSGLDVARTVKTIHAELPTIITSGYITDELREAARDAGIRDLVYKPNTVEELVQAITRSL
jgi:PAS domain S-box-containing protein